MKTMLSKEKLGEQAYRLLREMIVNSRFLPGARLNVEQLARDLVISRTPVWEAAQRLIQEGLLVSIPNRGVFVADLTPEAAVELYQVREVLEGLAARLAVRNLHPEAIARMEQCLKGQAAMVRQEDLMGYSRYDFAFHDVIYELSENKFLQEMLEVIRDRTRPTALDFRRLLTASYQDHQAVLAALKAADGPAAERTIRAHIRRLVRDLKKNRRRPENQAGQEKQSRPLNPLARVR
jgi:DNA-binding GntR family transcriptional regulator